MQLDDLAQRALGLCRASDTETRVVLGIAGSPGSGKTTLATAVVDRVNELAGICTAVHLPMDGFHLANSALDALGRRARKGAIDTFDGWGYVAMLRRLAAERDHTVYAPGFDRTIDEPVAGQIAVAPDARLVVTKGNYLLVDDPPWSLARPLFAETWFCATPAAERSRRLVARHQQFGRTLAEARHWADEVDGANAALIEPTAARASITVDDF
ncbi:nucleoside/nucleotide kinase family protein [Subtercola lobariae]|uniref:Nucleoside/nucleotide kinase family protein n=1 Tax=Subtercola lobariae TaxID=1588641 RepID=A0A917BEV6_9MICO|nr:nucleoside/nucleotide kinase family protein [Subtercola lobariae]GGF35347.1 nucleoside/nucleotide kinase family protein [Subtercola lobariae]